MFNHTLKFDSEAAHYYESTPVGNGRVGAMMFGNRVRERIVLNESTMWSGGPQNADRPDAYKVLPEIQRLLVARKFTEATELFERYFNCLGPGSGFAVGSNLPFGCYQALGDLNLYFFQAISHDLRRLPQNGGLAGAGQCEDVHGYTRELNMDTGISSICYTLNGTVYTRECVASRPYECIAIHMASTAPGGISFNAQLNRSEKFRVSAYGGDGLSMTGQLENGTDGQGVRYACILRAKAKGGHVYTEDNTLFVRGAECATLYITMATDMKVAFGGRNCADAFAAAEADMKKVYPVSWDALREESLCAHRALFERSAFSLNSCDDPRTLPERLHALRSGEPDPGLYELLYNFSRYLLIASNTPGGMPANLQGIWGDEIQTPWNGDWHIDAQQMNFWSAEVTGLPELHEPYLNLIHSLMVPGAKTAQAYYNARGWVAHVFTNPWGYTSPGESASWGATTTGSAWLCQHVWDHFLFSGDIDYLKWAYPVLKGCALFYTDILVHDPVTGYLVTAPANSPENSFFTQDGQHSALCIGPTYDNQLLRYVFKAVIEASGLLEIDSEFAAELAEKRGQLPPTRVGENGGVMEWLEDYESAQPYHRHISPLWGAYPGDEITPEDTPELAAAAECTITMRKGSCAGWANMHRIGVFARIAQGDSAAELLDYFLKYGCYSNLLCRIYHASETEPLIHIPDPANYSFPFQIDANLAAAGCMAELLLQSHRRGGHDGLVPEIHLLPALPAAWKNGSITGLRARGGFTVDISWADGVLIHATIRGKGDANVTYNGHTAHICATPDQSIILDGMLNCK